MRTFIIMFPLLQLACATTEPLTAGGDALVDYVADAVPVAAIGSDRLPPPGGMRALAMLVDDPAIQRKIPNEKNVPGDRKVVYTANLSLDVDDKRVTRDAIDGIIERYEGFTLSGTLDSVTFRVSPEHFDEALEALARLGDVISRDIRSEDVTSQYFDLTLRLEVAENSRKRLMELLKTTAHLKDVLEVEREIRRLTEEIETMKGTLRVLHDKVALATITANVREKPEAPPPPPSEAHVRSAPIFQWMEGIGIAGVIGPTTRPQSRAGLFEKLGLAIRARFRLGSADGRSAPEGFIAVLDEPDVFVASTPEDYRLRARLFEFHEPGSMDFWIKALGGKLDDQRYEVEPARSVDLNRKGLEAQVFRSATSYRTNRWAYDLWLIRNPRREKELLVVEFAALEEDAETYRPNVEKAIRGVRLR